MKSKKSAADKNHSRLTPLSRRAFLRAGAMATAALSFPYVGNVLGANDRINVACIGVGGKGDSDSSDAARCGGNIVAVCDVDLTAIDKKKQQFPQAEQFQDYRKMLDKMEKSIDAVTVSIPDHNHAIAAGMALTRGKHVYCQKPLVQTVYEAREIRKLAKEKKVATQMGNQGSAGDGLRRAVEIIQAGVIGPVRELHVWSNRPIWPQGVARPQGVDPVPSNLDWDQWIGPAPMRPFHKGTYHTFAWRGWYDFGCGALGDMACHTANMPFRALKLGYPNVVECEQASELFPETFPKTSRIRFEFPEREGQPPLKFWWYDGNPDDHSVQALRPPSDQTKEISEMQDKLPGSGCLLIADKGKLFSPDDYGQESLILLKGEKEYLSMNNHPAAKGIPQSIPRAPRMNGQGWSGDTTQKLEWFRMMREGTPAYSNFDIAAYLTEIILLGCVALRVGVGKKMDWDGPGMKSPNCADAEKFIRRHNRPGWEM
jgi:hypothetical protein